MKQILIRHTEDITPDEAFAHAFRAWRKAGSVVVFHDGFIVEFSYYSKHPCMTVFRSKEEGNGNG